MQRRDIIRTLSAVGFGIGASALGVTTTSGNVKNPRQPNSLGKDELSLKDWISLEDYGASTDAVDNSQAITNAFNAAAALNASIRSNGIYRCTSAIQLPIVNISGDITLDYSRSSVTRTYVEISGGKPIKLTTISSLATKNSTRLELESTSGITKGDILIISNQRKGTWSKYRDSYKAGEMIEVLSVRGNIITTMVPIYGNYDPKNNDSFPINVYKHLGTRTRNSISTMVRVRPKSGDNFAAIRVSYFAYSEIPPYFGEGSDYANIEYRGLFKCTVRASGRSNTSIISEEAQYSVRITDSQNVDILGGNNVSARHGITISSSGSQYTIVNRHIKAIGCYVGTTGEGSQPALDTHGNCEFISFINCEIIGGVNMSGDYITLSGCRVIIQNGHGRGTSIQGSECCGMNRVISNVDVYWSGVSKQRNRGFILDFGGNDQGFGKKTTSNSIFIVDGLRVHLDIQKHTENSIARIINQGSLAEVVLSLKNILISSKRGYRTGGFLIGVKSGAPFEKIMVSDFSSRGTRLNIRGYEQATLPHVSLTNIEVDGAENFGISVEHMQILLAHNITSINCQGCAIYFDFRSTTTGSASGFISSAKGIYGLANGDTGYSDTNSSIFISNAHKVVIQGCVFGTNSAQQKHRYIFKNIGELITSGNHTFGNGDESVVYVNTIKKIGS